MSIPELLEKPVPSTTIGSRSRKGGAAHISGTAGAALAPLVTRRQDKEKHPHFGDGNTEASRAQRLTHSVKNVIFNEQLPVMENSGVDVRISISGTQPGLQTKEGKQGSIKILDVNARWMGAVSIIPGQGVSQGAGVRRSGPHYESHHTDTGHGARAAGLKRVPAPGVCISFQNRAPSTRLTASGTQRAEEGPRPLLTELSPGNRKPGCDNSHLGPASTLEMPNHAASALGEIRDAEKQVLEIDGSTVVSVNGAACSCTVHSLCRKSQPGPPMSVKPEFTPKLNDSASLGLQPLAYETTSLPTPVRAPGREKKVVEKTELCNPGTNLGLSHCGISPSSK
ncbi:hypothetical protein MG293_007687 [Ovis ammon polii]|uniref:Uncharacterized protein n=1 Tax=Ovis ammon polii TaxID=230172 RepID=A0AAD4YC14_OVIAM|nr:hypothetical protein MG293_007687 [Ovis ammon polii]